MNHVFIDRNKGCYQVYVGGDGDLEAQGAVLMDFSRPEARKLYEEEVRRRMRPPFNMSRRQAEMLVAALMLEPTKDANRLGTSTGTASLMPCAKT